MKKLLSSLFAILLFAASPALADGYDLATKNILELPTLSAGSIASGDYVPVYDASALGVKKVDATSFSTGGAVIRSATDAVASGQTSKAVTVTGITAASKCVATANEVATNAVYIRAVVPTANTATVTTSGDPGASNLDLTVICVN